MRRFVIRPLFSSLKNRADISKDILEMTELFQVILEQDTGRLLKKP